MEVLTLSDCKRGKVYKIQQILVENKDVLNQLKNLEIEVGKEVEVVASNYGKKSFLVIVSGFTYAIDSEICDKVVCHE